MTDRNVKATERIGDRAFSRMLWGSVISILLCLVALCSMTYAWFSGEIESGDNTIRAGSFDLSVTVTGEGGEVLSLLPDETRADAVYCELRAGVTYTVELTHLPGSTVKGYCLLTLGEVSYRTDAIIGEETKNRGDREINDPFVFCLCPSEDVNLVITTRWGAPAVHEIGHGATLVH